MTFFSSLLFCIKNIESNSKIWNSILALASIALSLIYFGPALFAEFGIIDDHEIITFLHEKKQKGWIEGFIYNLKNTEVFKYGESARFRPSYYFLRIFESFIFQDNAFIWYFFRLIGYAFSTFIIFHISTQVFGLSLGAPFSFTVCSYPYWADIFARLGPGEYYAVVGCSLLALGIFNIYKSKNISKSHFINWSLITLGSIMAMGSKEYFVVTIIPVFLISYVFIKRNGGLSTQAIGAITLTLFYAIFVTSALAIYFSSHSLDIYAQSISPSSRGKYLIDLFKKTPGSLLLIEIIILLIIASVQIARKKVSFKPSTWGVVSILAVFFILCQIFFNNGVHITVRYAYPWVLFTMLFHLLFFYRMQDFFSPKKVKVCFLILCADICIKNSFGYKTRETSSLMATNTKIFQQKLSIIKDTLRQHPEMPVILVLNDPHGSYEPARSYLRYSQYYEIKNPYSFYINYSEKELKTRLSRGLHKGNLSLQENGNSRLTPLKVLIKNKRYFLVNFNQPKHDNNKLKNGELITTF